MRISHLINGLFVVIFLVVISAPVLDRLFDIAPEIQLRENRDLAPKPESQEKFRFKRFRKQFEPYFNDHFGFRTLLLTAYNRLHFAAFKTADGVVFGNDGWLFLEKGVRADLENPIPVIKDLCGEALFSNHELEQWRNSLLTNWIALQERGIEYLYLPVPNKHRIYQRHLPKYGRCEPALTRLDQLVDQLTKISNYPIIDLRPTYAEHATREQLYFQRDTHWNDQGVALAYRAIMKKLNGQVLLRDISNTFEFAGRHQQGGDLALMTGMERRLSEPYQAIRLQQFSAREVNKDFPGIRQRVRVFEQDDISLGTVLVFHDSFGVGIFSYLLAESFSEATFVQRASPILRMDIIDRIKPDLVIHEMVERALLLPYFE